jgi:LAO/AO transport system kinase
LTNTGIDEMWSLISRRHTQLKENGQLIASRQNQQVKWMWDMVENKLLNNIKFHDGIQSMISEIEKQVRNGTLTPALAVEKIFSKFRE